MFKKSALTLAVLFAATQMTACSSSDENQAPTDIQLSHYSVEENAMGAVIGTLSATDEDNNDSHTFTVSDERFVVVNSELKLVDNAALNFEQEQTIELAVKVSDQDMAEFTKTLTIEVTDMLDTYNFGDSVSYSGQVARQLLILELTNYIDKELEHDLGTELMTRQQVLDKLMSFYKTDADAYANDLSQRAFATSSLADAKQTSLSAISSSKKDLYGKIAGNDEKGQHKVWAEEFVAFGAKGAQSPDTLIQHFFAKIADHAELGFNGVERLDAFGDKITKVYLGEDGLDYKQLVQKVLLGAVNFSQGADDYLDDNTEGKGLLSDHTDFGDSKPYSVLEHQFDEGFGYFGAARDYMEYSDDEIAGKDGREEFKGKHDTDGDGEIDLLSEFNFGHSVNAAKRDRATANHTNPTDFTKDAMTAFIKGRELLRNTAGTDLDEAQMTELLGYRDTALIAWEKAIAATAVHYINDVNGDYGKFDTADFSYADLAKHWSELKGFVIGLQFSPNSPLSDEQHEAVNALVGDAPELDADKVSAYAEALLEARSTLATAYEFHQDNVTNW